MNAEVLKATATARSSGSLVPVVIAAFGTYFCMYGFRKPFTAGQYAESSLFGLDHKSVIVIAQVLGYMLSKFIGIPVMASIRPHQRIPLLLLLIVAAELSLIVFGLLPNPWNAAGLFLNGLSLGMIFGIVMGYLEGRRNTEALLAGLCTSFILADGVMKSVGQWLLEMKVPEAWMPAVAGGLFFLPLLLFAMILRRTPPPNGADVEARSERSPMAAADRRRCLQRYGVGLALIVLVFLLVTILRSVRADFSREIWNGLGTTINAGLYTRSEAGVALGILILNGTLVAIRNNRTAFFTGLALSMAGILIVLAAVIGWNFAIIGPFAFMVLVGLGIYMPYIAVHTTIFERFIAMTRERGTVGYFMYLADAFGYLGFVAMLIARKIFADRQLTPMDNLLPFFLTLCIITGVLCVLLLIPCGLFFRRSHHTAEGA
ncbi:DUF5690 family protein [soil metagenome]